MQKIRYGLIVLGILLCLATSAAAEVSIGISFPHVSIGINLPLYPELVPVPDYPVYYAPQVDANYFFYDGMYWIYQNDDWYTSDWYDGPWWLVEPDYVPVFILRIPVRYYRQPPVYFYGWPSYAPPRWNHHWGREWEQRRRGWDRWDRRSVPPPAPRPDYQRQYSGNRYPRVEQQQTLQQQHYRYQPRDTMIRERIQPRLQRKTPPPAPRERGEEPSQRQREDQRETPRRQFDPDDKRAQPAPQTLPRQRGSAVRDLEQRPGSVQQRERAEKEGHADIDPAQQQPGTVQQREREQQRPRPQDRELKRQEQVQDQRQIQGQQGQRQEKVQDQRQEKVQDQRQEKVQDQRQEKVQDQRQEKVQDQRQEKVQGQRQEKVQGQGQVKGQVKGQKKVPKKDKTQEEKDQEKKDQEKKEQEKQEQEKDQERGRR